MSAKFICDVCDQPKSPGLLFQITVNNDRNLLVYPTGRYDGRHICRHCIMVVVDRAKELLGGKDES